VSLRRGFGALMKSNDRRFVQLLCQQADLAVKALDLLEEYGSDKSQPDRMLETIKDVERQGDEIRRVLIDELVHTFATPFDREDLFALSRTIDDILDAANEAAIELALYRIGTPENLKEMAHVLAEGARHIRAAVEQLLVHPAIASEHAVRAKRSENRIDALYHQAVSNLFDSNLETRQVFKTREVYQHLKNSADRIDRAADDISVIVIKRT
jgi:uncharacterized protein